MNRRRTAFLLTVCLAAPCLVYAQAGSEKKPSAPQMQEDVEIMRRILNRSLDLPRQSTHTVWAQNNGLNNYTTSPFIPLGNPGAGGIGGIGGNHGGAGGMGGQFGISGGWGGQNVTVSGLAYPSAEGIYLKGHGVIYTLTLPPQLNLKAGADSSSKDKPLTEWDRVRKEVRGEKAEQPAKPKKEPTLLDTILKVLAENGTHLSQLGPDETVTIVVTFRESEGPKNPWPQDWWISSSDTNTGFDVTLKLNNSNQPVDLGATDPERNGVATPPKELGGTPAKEVPAAVKDNILLGELSLKQGKVQEAEKAYLIALKLLEKEGDVPSLQQVYQGLAQAYLTDGKTEEASKYLEKAIALKKTIASNPNQPKKEARTPSPAVTKLVVSAPKKLLDGVASGKITLEEFKKEVVVDYSDAAPAEKKDGK